MPPADLLPYRYERRAPYFFSDDEIRALLQTAIALPAKDGWANHTHYYLIGLLSVTGIRISEALNLTMDDVDLDNAVLAIHSTKFGKSRLVPLHQSTVKALADYRERRARFLKGRQVPYWFVDRQGKQVRCDTFDRQFRRLTDELGLVAANGQRPPHLHDLRHHSPCRHSCDGIAMVKILTVDCLSSRPISAMSIFTVHIGICPHSPRFWLLPGIS